MNSDFALPEAIYGLILRLYYRIFVDRKLKSILTHHNKYYLTLGKRQPDFRFKVWEFIRVNKFIARDTKLTFSLKVIIASHAVQIALNLPEESYDYYEKIILYKDYYRSRITGKLHKGEVNPSARTIVFSIRAIYESTKLEDDGLNVLLHEFAHALWLEHMLMGHEYKIFNETGFAQFRQVIKSILQSPEDRESGFFRKYAFTNEAEFFAVAVENFFERSAEFETALPEFYFLLGNLLKQDPAHKKLSVATS